MKRPILFTTALLASGLVLAGCTATAATSAAPAAAQQQESTVATPSSDSDLAPEAVIAENANYTTVNEDEWSEADTVDIELTGSGARTSASGAAVSGSTVTIAEAGVYRLSGALHGQVVVAAPDDALVVLILDGVDISNEAGAAIWVQAADDVAIHLADGSSNSVSDAASYAEDADANAAVYADADLTVTGGGSLTVTGNGNDGITSTDDLVILGGAIAVTAADDALRGKDALMVEGGTLDLTAIAGDGMKSDGDDDEASADIDWTRGYIYVSGGEIDIEAGDDGLQAFTDTVIAGGSVTAAVADDGVKAEVIVAIGEISDAAAPSVTVTASTEGIEAANIGIGAGTVDVTASDDGINASGNAELQAFIAGTEFTGVADREADTGERLEISGGTVTVNAAFDGLDSNGSITISGGSVTITSAANGGDAPIDANGAVSVAEGTVTANGSPWDESMAMRMGPGGGMSGEMPGGEMPGGGMPGQPPQG